MELMDLRNRYNEDTLGFTNQTAVLLCGIGAKELLPQFRKRNISIEALAELSVSDLQLIGADYELANHMHKELSVISKCNDRFILTPQQRFDQLFEALVNNNKHLSLIQAYVTYARLRINKEHIDSFVERDKNLLSSKALEMAAAATISEIQDARLALQELKFYLEDSHSSKSIFVYLAVIGGMGLMTYVLLKKYF